MFAFVTVGLICRLVAVWLCRSDTLYIVCLALQLVIQHSSCDCYKMLPTCIVHKLNHIKLIPGTCMYLIIAAGSLPLAHNAQHSTSIHAMETSREAIGPWTGHTMWNIIKVVPFNKSYILHCSIVSRMLSFTYYTLHNCQVNSLANYMSLISTYALYYSCLHIPECGLTFIVVISFKCSLHL